MKQQNAAYWIERLMMAPHPEGGYYKEVFRSEQEVVRTVSAERRQACTSIYYLLEGQDFSGFHRLISDEIWYFHAGSPIHIHIIDKQGAYHIEELSVSDSGSLSVVVPGGFWFAAEIPTQLDFSLVSCAVAPGFDFSEFEMAEKAKLIALYPEHDELLRRLCR